MITTQQTTTENTTGYCYKCGEPMFITETGVSHHGELNEINYELDSDHVSYLDKDTSVDEQYSTLSISDDDLCADCKFCYYSPGKDSSCKFDFPAVFDENGYAVTCHKYKQLKQGETNINELPILP